MLATVGLWKTSTAMIQACSVGKPKPCVFAKEWSPACWRVSLAIHNSLSINGYWRSNHADVPTIIAASTAPSNSANKHR